MKVITPKEVEEEVSAQGQPYKCEHCHGDFETTGNTRTDIYLINGTYGLMYRCCSQECQKQSRKEKGLELMMATQNKDLHLLSNFP